MKKLPLVVVLSVFAGSVFASDDHKRAIDQKDAIISPSNSSQFAEFDILAAHVHQEGDTLTFHMTTNGTAGEKSPEPVGELGGAQVLSYVWPTSLDPSVVGFDEEAGILAMAATNHPDFDDTPLYDENADGNLANDGGVWHSHWVVLTPTESCGPGALAVKDIPKGTTPNLPATWPGLPILIDSPGFMPIFDGPEVIISAAVLGSAAAEVSYDGVTAALKVNDNIHAPLLCVTDVFDVASGDLSLPGKVSQ